MAKACMILGTTSNAGKSLLTAGLCRILKQDGYRVAPFKAQNMALNSFITKDGKEMGRAQVVQAQAAGLEPEVRMNPILLKPTTDHKSQVIVMGEVRSDMSAKEYYRAKAEIFPIAREAFLSLAEEYDVILCEGAGSPAEINLKDVDIVNMGFARAMDIPAIIVGDIDRGGVFASLAGTMLLFDEEERALTKGMLINKFRGDESILTPGLRQLEDLTKVPVLGVIPFLDVDVEEEDSLAEILKRRSGGGLIDIAVLRTPHISNFTDLDALSHYEDVSVRYIRHREEFGTPDLCVIPGSKNTLADLRWLREQGLDAFLKRHVIDGRALLGICGGYQMLGEALHDPLGVEEGGSAKGLGLLPVETVFEGKKTTRQIEGEILSMSGEFSSLAGAAVEGYEIHMGQTTRHGAEPFLRLGDHEDGCVSGSVMGTYLHGVFDHPEASKRLISHLFEKKGMKREVKEMDLDAYREEQFDRLAEGIRAHMDLNAFYEILGLQNPRR